MCWSGVYGNAPSYCRGPGEIRINSPRGFPYCFPCGLRRWLQDKHAEVYLGPKYKRTRYQRVNV